MERDADPEPYPPDAPSALGVDGAAGPGFRQHLRAWLAIGSQSIGGGAATLYLMRRILVRQRHWLTDVEFSQDWILSKTSPGLTMIALTALVGRRIDGWRGLATALSGLLVPSVVLTIAMAAGFAYIRDQPLVQAALLGIGPATIGLTLAMMTIFARTSMRPGSANRIDAAFLAVVVVAGTLVPSASIAIILVAALIGWAALGDRTPRVPAMPPDDAVTPDTEVE
jgi:chromate transporter